VNPIQERIRYYTEWGKILWLTLIADVGGVAGLILGPSWPWKEVVVLIGVMIGMIFLSLILILHVTIEGLIKTGGKGDV
jgi:hypothetical protein